MNIGERVVGSDQETFLVAEVGSNHNCDLPMAKTLIEMAARTGWNAVKFQSFRAAWLYPPNCGVVDTPMGKVDFFDVLEKNQLPIEWLPKLREYAEECGLCFICTPFDEDAVAELGRLMISAIKIASPELNHLPLLRCAAKTRLPLICSTGLCTLSDIEEALRTIQEISSAGPIMLMHCVSAYPTPEDQCNLLAIETLRRAFDVAVGYSDHTTDIEVVPAVAVSVGACAIEKHITVSRDLRGPDHAFALEENEMRKMARIVREIESSPLEQRLSTVRDRFGKERVAAVLGHGRKVIMPVEEALYPHDKRSIHSIRAIHVGERLSEDNMRILRSERNLEPGLHPRYWQTILGATAVEPISLGQGVQWHQIIRK